METLRDELAIIQAQVAVQNLVLQSLVHSHPQPDLLLQQWRRLRADRVAQSYALPADARSSDWLSQHMQVFAEDWTAELVDVIARGRATSADRQRVRIISGLDSSDPKWTQGCAGMIKSRV